MYQVRKGPTGGARPYGARCPVSRLRSSSPTLVAGSAGGHAWVAPSASGAPEGTAMTHSAFHEGPFAPVTEEITAFDLPVTGSLPVELSGRYLRNGPNPIGLDDAEAHWFLGRGHGARRPAARWPGRVVPQPLGAVARCGRGTGRDLGGRPGARREGFPGQHTRPRARWTDPRHRGVRSAALRADRRAGHGRAVRLRRHPAGRLRRAHQARPADRRPARDRLLLGLGPHPAHRRRPRWHGRLDHRHPGQRRADDPRLRPDRALRRPVRPAGHLQHGRGRRGKPAALHVEPDAPGPNRPAAPRGDCARGAAGSR